MRVSVREVGIFWNKELTVERTTRRLQQRKWQVLVRED